MTYGDRLRELRAERHLSLREVEERGGPNKDTMSLIERGVHKPYPQTLGRIAQALEMNVSELRAELEAAEDPLGEAPASSQLTLNGLLEEDRREVAYGPWLEFVNRYADRWEARISAGDLDLGSINEFARILDELLPTLAELDKRERLEVPTPTWEDLKMNQAIGRLMSLFNPLLVAAASKFESSELEQVRRKRAELDRQIAEAG